MSTVSGEFQREYYLSFAVGHIEVCCYSTGFHADVPTPEDDDETDDAYIESRSYKWDQVDEFIEFLGEVLRQGRSAESSN